MGSPTQTPERLLAQKTGAESLCTSFAVFMLCRDSSAAQLRNGGLSRHLLGRPRKAPLFRVPLFFQSSGGQSPPSGKKISGFWPKILLGRAIRRGSLLLAKEAELDGFQPPSFAMAAFAAICLAVPEKLRFSGFPYFFNPQAGRARLPARKFPAFSRKFCLDAPFGAARFRSQEAELDGFQPPSFAMAALAAICSASFLLWPLPEPTGVPFRSTSTKKRLSWSGPSSPVRRYFSTWPLSRWTSS